ncbi:hypothetical protein [Hominenteromicrobium sp.]|uniref:hypothetical protein n=1 Tax=Hominenteromicrobium sp. TaxID=3073581 RepID=UPI003AF169BF
MENKAELWLTPVQYRLTQVNIEKNHDEFVRLIDLICGQRFSARCFIAGFAKTSYRTRDGGA